MMSSKVYRFLLNKLYPREYAEQFGAEMTWVFEQVAAEQRKRGSVAFVRFIFRELLGLVAWARDAHEAPLLIGRLAVNYSVPAELADAQRAMETTKQEMQKAIIAHDFKKARLLSFEEENARDDVRRLRSKYGLGS